MFFCSLFELFVLSAIINTAIGGQHRWAPAYLAACRVIYVLYYLLHVYFFS